MAGFIIGGVSRWEYGMPANIGWIDIIGVDPDRQRLGLAKVLFDAIAQRLKQMGVTSINTFVTKRNWKMRNLFQSLGFHPGDMTSLELEL